MLQVKGVIAEYERVGLRPLRRWPVGPVADGLALVESFVDPAEGRARLTIHPRCAATIRALKRKLPEVSVEVLTPDFLGVEEDALRTVLEQSDTWLKACALYEVGEKQLKEFCALCEKLSLESDPLIRETAEWALKRCA